MKERETLKRVSRLLDDNVMSSRNGVAERVRINIV